MEDSLRQHSVLVEWPTAAQRNVPALGQYVSQALRLPPERAQPHTHHANAAIVYLSNASDQARLLGTNKSLLAQRLGPCQIQPLPVHRPPGRLGHRLQDLGNDTLAIVQRIFGVVLHVARLLYPWLRGIMYALLVLSLALLVVCLALATLAAGIPYTIKLVFALACQMTPLGALSTLLANAPLVHLPADYCAVHLEQVYATIDQLQPPGAPTSWDNATWREEIVNSTQRPLQDAYTNSRLLDFAQPTIRQSQSVVNHLLAVLTYPPSSITEPELLRGPLEEVKVLLPVAHRMLGQTHVEEVLLRQQWKDTMKSLREDATRVKALSDARSPLMQSAITQWYAWFPSQYQYSPSGRIVLDWLDAANSQAHSLAHVVQEGRATLKQLDLILVQLDIAEAYFRNQEAKWHADCQAWHPLPGTTTVVSRMFLADQTLTTTAFDGTAPAIARGTPAANMPPRCSRTPRDALNEIDGFRNAMRFLRSGVSQVTETYSAHQDSVETFKALLEARVEQEKTKAGFAFGAWGPKALDLRTVMPLLELSWEVVEEMERFVQEETPRRNERLREFALKTDTWILNWEEPAMPALEAK